MDKFVHLANLLQISRLQPQYGYASTGANMRLGNLAEHHYLVTMLGWQLAEMSNAAGASIDTFKVMKFCLLHDIGELFGGDIGMPYAEANPKARPYAKQFEEENQKFLSRFFFDQDEMRQLSKEILESSSDEAHISKVADYVECLHYKLFNDRLVKNDLDLAVPKLKEKIESMADEAARSELSKFLEAWEKRMLSFDSFQEASLAALRA